MIVIISFFSIFVLIGVVNFLYYKLKERKYYKTIGVIIDNQASEDEMEPDYASVRNSSDIRLRHYILYSPVVKFTDKNGETQTILFGDSNPYAPMYPVGTKIKLLVNPNDSTRLLFDDVNDKVIVPLVCVSISALVGVPHSPMLVFFTNIYKQKPNTSGIFERNGLSTTLSVILHRYYTKLETSTKAR